MPAGPSHDPSLRASVTTAAAYAPSIARQRNPSGTSQLEENAAQYGGDAFVPCPAQPNNPGSGPLEYSGKPKLRVAMPKALAIEISRSLCATSG